MGGFGSVTCIMLAIYFCPDSIRQPLLCHALRAADSIVLEGGEQQHQSITASQAVTISTFGNAGSVEL
jgi:hypothetical protein